MPDSRGKTHPVFIHRSVIVEEGTITQLIWHYYIILISYCTLRVIFSWRKEYSILLRRYTWAWTVSKGSTRKAFHSAGWLPIRAHDFMMYLMAKTCIAIFILTAEQQKEPSFILQRYRQQNHKLSAKRTKLLTLAASLKPMNPQAVRGELKERMLLGDHECRRSHKTSISHRLA